MTHMFFRARRSFAYWRFNRAIAGILDTPPLQMRPAPWTVVSMVAKRDVPMYLVALKAFYRRAGGGQVVAIVDRDTPAESLATLKHHVPGIEFVILEDIAVGPCQRGGTWERIIYCLDRAEREYVIQLDADAVACGPDLQEVLDCVEKGASFTMAEGNQIVPMLESAAYAKTLGGNYIGTVAEAAFDRYARAETLHYIRGSSGFAGFAKGAFPRQRIEEFHAEGERLVGAARWREWGTEQCASNFAVANSPGAIGLPFPAYTSYHAGAARDGVKLYHFIGSFRFDDGFFAGLGRKEIAKYRGS
jgi:hypothetical protein